MNLSERISKINPVLLSFVSGICIAFMIIILFLHFLNVNVSSAPEFIYNQF